MSKAKRSRLFWPLTGLFSVFFLTLLDQLTKVLAVTQLKGQKPFVLFKGVLELSYLENRGMAFGLSRERSLILLPCACFFLRQSCMYL